VTLRLRETPEDFRVDEVPAYAPRGEGEHTFVRVEKRLRTTEEVARALARAAGVRPGDVGYAGRKDRVAVATQWFSVPGLDPDRAAALELPGARVLEAARHPHKLRTGHLRGNRFEIAVRGASEEIAAAARGRLGEIARRGFPNRYGPQRYGRAGDNAARARALCAGEATTRMPRRDARFLLSALQAEVFDAALAARAAPLDALEPGDLAMRHDSGGLFLVEDLERESERARDFEISATGPIFGTRMPEPGGAVAAREQALLAERAIDLAALRLPRGVRLRGARRAIRARPDGAELDYADGVLWLRFGLPAGSYASVLVEELVGPCGAPRD
jgi:tRNA pseudouridine13 synthase